MGVDYVLKVNTKDSQKLANQIKDAMGVEPDICNQMYWCEVNCCHGNICEYNVVSNMLLLGNSFRSTYKYIYTHS